jgi:hypothetical protein
VGTHCSSPLANAAPHHRQRQGVIRTISLPCFSCLPISPHISPSLPTFSHLSASTSTSIPTPPRLPPPPPPSIPISPPAPSAPSAPSAYHEKGIPNLSSSDNGSGPTSGSTIASIRFTFGPRRYGWAWEVKQQFFLIERDRDRSREIERL